MAAPAAFIFDLDGTLVDSAPGISAALAAAFLTIGRTAPLTDIRSVIGPPIRIMAQRLFPDLSDQQALAVEFAYRPLYDEGAWQQTKLYPAVAETLTALRTAGHRLFVATNKPQLPARRILTHLGLLPLFEDIATRDIVTPPHANKAAVVASLLARHNLTPDSTLFVGDTTEDAEAAAANALPFVFMTHGYGQPSLAFHLCDNFAELLHYAPKGVSAQ
jgi:phosphoglycolate phosphatase